MTGNDELIERVSRNLGLPFAQLPFGSPKFALGNMLASNCVLVKGDNLTVLSQLQEEAQFFDFCYIDPPYNTGQVFAYNDRRSGLKSPLWGEHTEWMSFMVPRLVGIWSVLNDSGILAVSIDDYEYARLKIILDMIFGEKNCIATLVVNRSRNGKGSKPSVSVNHEYVLLYGRTSKASLFGLPERDVEGYDRVDRHGRFKIDGLFRKKGEASRREDRPAMHFPLYYDDKGNVFVERVSEDLKEVFPVDSSGGARRWLWGKEKAREDSWKLYASPKGVVYVKNYLSADKRIKVKSIWDDLGYLTDKATNEVKEIFGEKVFETPKPLALIADLIQACCPSDGRVLDAFAGTGTTAHAVSLLNSTDNGKRKSLIIEQDSEITAGHIAMDFGFKTLADVTQARLSHIAKTDSNFTFSVIAADFE